MQAKFRRNIAVMAIAVLAAVPAVGADLARTPPRPLSSALHAADRGAWDRALELAARDGQVARDVIEWHRLRSGEGTLEEVQSFVDTHPDWPGLDYLRKRGEHALAAASDAEVLKYFTDNPPQTGSGVLIHAGALERAGERGEAQAGIVLAWRSMELSLDEHARFLEQYGALLKAHHTARLDMALWRRLRDDADRMRGLVSAQDWKLAETRLAIQRDEPGLDERIEGLTDAQKQDAGLAYDRFYWRARKGLDDGAKELLLERSAIPGGLGLAEEWAGRRRGFAREAMRAGKAEEAYRLASQHQLTTGSDFADLEWLSGYIALRKLNAPETALIHFSRFLTAVETPISLGRGYYWLGRAYEAEGDLETAKAAYRDGAKHQTSFYGLLAAEKAGVAFDKELAGTETFGDWRQSPLARSDLREAGMLLLAAGQASLAERFFMQLADTLERPELGLLGGMFEELGETHLEVMLGKQAAQRNIVLSRHYYALHPMREMTLPVPAELALTIARRESEFDARVTSQVGAGGLMQLMPGTAREVARNLGMVHQASAVWEDWSYNATLGSAYLAQLARRFDGNVMLVSAGYNAGPGRSLQWMDAYGDPRSRVVDAVDWVEHIPFNETRNYVMRVAESLPVYRARLGKDPLPVPFSQELKGGTLLLASD
ncbi:tail length tape measure protein [Oceanicola sp. 22II-s10i]|uniref:lytic transglycosylase domain-containing protein n=1 Tax=Oceanicola sp. 22II-s10i TaxID=1317116 RepID=UPI000B5273DA|nr:lytic transglycosylase domain-containing protein [Oceanicola sp. 22II-s10i]OWU85773.1 tail length tape measure protein [Oceanicola sp. 22II-s10i]